MMTDETDETDARLAATIPDADVFTEDEADNIARIAVALNMSAASFDAPDLHRRFIALLTKTKALRAHVDDADRRAARYRDLFLGGLRSELEQRAAAITSAEQRGYRRGVEACAQLAESLKGTGMRGNVVVDMDEELRALLPVEPKPEAAREPFEESCVRCNTESALCARHRPAPASAASEDYEPTPEELARLCEKEDTALASPPQAATGGSAAEKAIAKWNALTPQDRDCVDEALHDAGGGHYDVARRVLYELTVTK